MFDLSPRPELPLKRIPISEPYLTGNESKYLLECVESGWISSLGDFITRFEQDLAKYHDLKYGIACSNCTTALHLALKIIDVGPGDEVLCPDLTFIAPANMIVLSGAKPVLVDIDPQTLCIDGALLEEKITPRTKAIIVVHQFGHAANMDQIMAIARKYGLYVIEDNAESPGAKYKGRLLGSIGDISCYSFFANKILTTGEGGAILTNDERLANRCRELRDHGMSRMQKYLHVELGYNYRMTNMQAAIGVAQLERFDHILAKRKAQMEYYYQALRGLAGIKLRSFAEWCEPVHWLMTMTLAPQYDRDSFLSYMKERGVDCRQMINPVHQAQHFKADFDDKDFPITVKVSKQSVHLPSGTGLTVEQMDYVVEQTKRFLAGQ